MATGIPTASAEYWRQREQAWIAEQARTEGRAAKELARRYGEAFESIEKEIAAQFGRYAGPRGFTMSEAQALADLHDVRLFADKAKRYVRDKDFTDEANQILKLFNLKMRTSRLQLLKNQIALELIALGSAEEQYLAELLTTEGVKHLTEQAGILNLTIPETAKRVEQIVNASFQTATWSERIWANQEELRGEVDKLLTRGVINGEHPLKLAPKLQKRFDVTRYESERIARTEMVRVHTQVAEDLFIESGYKEYVYIAETTACPICSRLDDTVHAIAAATVGVNKPPMHPNCKCSTAPHFAYAEETPTPPPTAP